MKGGESGTEQHYEVEWVKQKGDEAIPNNAVKQKGEIPWKDSRIIHQVIHKNNQMLVQIVRGTVSITRQVTCTSICVITSQEQVMKNALHVVDAIFARQT